MRAHYRNVIQDTAGNLSSGASVAVYQPGTTTSITGPLYADGSSGSTLTNPFTSTDGVISFYLAEPQRVDLAVTPAGGEQVTFKDIDLVTQPAGVINWLNVVAGYGADPSGAVDSTTAIQAAINSLPAGGGVIYFPAGTYKVNLGPLTPVYGLRLTGDTYESTTISCTGRNLFNMDAATGLTSSNHNLENIEIDHLTLDVTGGDIFNGANIVRSSVHHCQLKQNSLGNAIWNMSPSTGLGTTYMAECEFYSNSEILTASGSRTISAWNINATGPFAANDNLWRWNVCFNNGHDTAQPWYYIIGASGSGFGSRNNRFQKITFEYPQGGMIRLESTTGDTIDDCTSEDLASLTIGSNAMIQLVSGAGTAGCSGITVRNYARRGGNNMGTDIKLDSRASQILIDSPSLYSGGHGLTIDYGNAAGPVTEIGFPTTITRLNVTAISTFGAVNMAAWADPAGSVPSDLGYVGWAYDPAQSSVTTGQNLSASGTVQLIRVPVRTAQSITNVRVHVITAGGTLTAGQCFAGVYLSSGALLATSADQATAWASTGTLDMALTGAPFTVTSPYVWVALVYNGTTSPQFWGVAARSNGMANGKLATGKLRFGTANTTQTSLPASLSGFANGSSQIWAAIW